MTRHWEPGVAYSTGETLGYQGQKYKVIQGHTSQSDWAPGPATAALFQRTSSDDHCEPPKQEHKHCYEHPQVPAPVQNTSPTNADHPKTRDEWLQNARRHTDEFNRNGPRAPTTWVLVSGGDIPPEAIEAGREGDNVLYIARAYIEDGLYVGKAGKHLGQGAEIGRQHKCYALHEYEILIGDTRGVRWVETRGAPNPSNFGARHVDAGVDGYGCKLFITQVSHNGGIHPARASSGGSGAYLAYGDKEFAFQEYRVLCYA